MDTPKPNTASDRPPMMFVLVAFLAVATAFDVAAVGFGWGLPGPTHVQSYHPDEQNITYSLRNMDPRRLDFNPRFFGNPTFYTYQVGALALAAGALRILPLAVTEDYWLAHPDAVRRFYILGRSLSLAYALAALALLYALARRVTGSRRGAVFAAAVFAALPVTAVHCHYMTVNAAAVFWSLAALYFAVRIVDDRSWRNYLYAGLCAGLAISTKLSNAFLPLAIVAAGLAAQRGPGQKGRFMPGRLWAALALCAAAFFVGSPYYVLSYSSVAGDPHQKMNLAALLSLPAQWRQALSDFWNHLTAACGWGFAIVLPLAVPASFFAGNRRTAPLLAVAVPFLLLAVKSGWWAFPSRLWPFLALTAVLLAAVTERKGAAAVRITAVSAAVAGLVTALVWNGAYMKLTLDEHVRAESSRSITASVPEGAKIAVLDTPYYEEPDIVYENALHGGSLAPVKYEIIDLKGHFGSLGYTGCDWLVITQRFDAPLRRATGKGIVEYAQSNGFKSFATFRRTFDFFGWQLRDWIPADMVQNYPVYVFRRADEPPPLP